MKSYLIQFNSHLNSDQNEKSFRFLVDANDKSEWMWKFYFKYVINMFFGSYVVGGVTSVLVCYYQFGRFDHERVYVPYSFM